MIDVRSVASASPDPSTTYTITIGPAETNDVLIVDHISRNHQSSQDSCAITDTDLGGNSWTTIEVESTRKVYSWGKRATSDTSGKVITVSGCKNSSSGVLTVYSGVIESGTFYSNARFENNPPGNEDSAGFTPSTASSMVHFALFQGAEPTNASDVTCTNPGGGLTLRARHSSVAGGLGGCGVEAWSRLQPGGPASTGTFTWSQSNGTTKVISFALIPNPDAEESSSSQNPVHTYARAGTYVIGLTVTDNDGLTSHVTKSVTVS